MSLRRTLARNLTTQPHGGIWTWPKGDASDEWLSAFANRMMASTTHADRHFADPPDPRLLPLQQEALSDALARLESVRREVLTIALPNSAEAEQYPTRRPVAGGATLTVTPARETSDLHFGTSDGRMSPGSASGTKEVQK